VGSKKQASYRIVVAESNAPRDGRAIAILGHYNPLTDPYTLKVDEERTVHWLESGAQPSETARGLLVKAGVITAYEAARKSSAQPKKADGEAAEETKARRAARSPSGGPKRTEPARLARPARREVGEGETHATATVAKKPAAAKSGGRAKTAAKAGAKPAAKAKATPARKTAAASRTAKPKAAAAKKS